MLSILACNSNKKYETPINSVVVDSIPNYNDIRSKAAPLILSTIDSVSIGEIKHYGDGVLPTIFDYYKKEEIDEIDIWSDKMFGRCCTEADLNYSELLEFDITSNVQNKEYPPKNLSDQAYRSAYVFKEKQEVEIVLKLNAVEEHDYYTDWSFHEVLKPTDTVLKPFKLSLVNGYVKSEKTFKENGRIKELKVFLNSNYKGTVKLLDSPLVQEFELDFTFSKNDTVQLKPIRYYRGSVYDDICISEIQSSLSRIAHKSINTKYNVRALWNAKN